MLYDCQLSTIREKRDTVANIISLNEKLKDAKHRKANLLKRRKLSALETFFQGERRICERCHCEITSNRRENRNLKVPYAFCEICSEEYVSYIERMQGKPDPELYWQNEIWMEVWKRWIDYRGAVDYYIQSKEFQQLREELTFPEPG
jgi:hypothetical protein